MKRFCYSIIGLLAYFFLATSVAASSAFDADYDLDYSVAPSGITIVTQKVTLTNKETNLYPRQYEVIIDTEKIQNILARDGVGLISPTITKNDGKTTIGLVFNEQVVGLGKQLTFTIRYDNLDIAAKNGSIWEVYVPGVADDESLKTYAVTLSVPPSFGPVAYRSPTPVDGRRWNKEQMIRGGIAAAYGKEQAFALTLGYFLQNPRLTPVVSEIALPPDTAYQRVVIQSLQPSPKTVRRDDDGNWLANYELYGGQRLSIQAKLTALLSLTPRENWIEDIDPTVYTRPLQYWESGDPKIMDLSKKYTTPREIYQYVTNYLSYDYKRIDTLPVRRGARAALSSPNESLCMEFTDLFVAIARAAGIPAREVVGFAYTTNAKLRPLSLVTDVLHAWPEYYDAAKKQWIAVDPTWGNTTGGVDYFTKLDFNHIAFAIHGLTSSLPYPAGSYREDKKEGKDVEVTFADVVPKFEPGRLSSKIEFPKTVAAGKTAEGKLIVTNTSGVAVDAADIAITASPFSYSMTDKKTRIPPFAQWSYPIKIPIANYVASGNGRISVTVNGQRQDQDFSVAPMYWLVLPVFGVVTGSLFLVWFFVVSIRSHARSH